MSNEKFVPKVGDDVTYPSGFGVVKVADPDQNGIIIITNSLGEYIRVSLHNIDPLKTTDEIEQESKVKVWVPSGLYSILGNGSFRDDFINMSYANQGNVRKTGPLARREIERRRPANIISAYVDEFAPDYKPDWGNSSVEKWFIAFSHINKKWQADMSLHHEDVGIKYMPEHLAKQLLADIKSRRVIL